MSAIGQRRLTRWDTPFGRWVHETGVSSIVAALGRDPDLSVTPQAVYMWIAGRHCPSPARCIALVRLSRGQLTMEAVYQHRNQVRPIAGAGLGEQPTRRVERR